VEGRPWGVVGMVDGMFTGRGPVRLDRDAVQLAAHDMASEGLRVLAMANRVLPPVPVELDGLEEPGGLTLLGLQGMADPPREGARDAIAGDHHDAHARVVMITGDHAAT